MMNDEAFKIPLYERNPPIIFNESSEIVVSRAEYNALRAAIKAMEDAEPDKTKIEMVIGAIHSHMSIPLYPREVAAAAQYIVHRYCTHPAPAVPEERNRDLDEFNEVGQAYDQGWNDCRKAMLAVYVPAPAVPEYHQRLATEYEKGLSICEADYRELAAKYDELLDQITTLHGCETRHETALRYIRAAENQLNAMSPKP